MTVYSDLIENEQATKTRMGWNITRSFVVDGLSSGFAHSKALTALNSLGIDIGYQHPTFTDSYAQTIDIDTVSSDIKSITVNYEPMTNVPDEISTSTN